MQTQILHFACWGSIWVHESSTGKGWGGSPSCCCTEMQMQRRLLWGMCWLGSTCIKNLLWADTLRVCFVTKSLICLNSLGYEVKGKTQLWAWMGNGDWDLVLKLYRMQQQTYFQKLRVPATFQKKLRRALLCYSS